MKGGVLSAHALNYPNKGKNMQMKTNTGFVGGGLLGVLGFSLLGLTIAMGAYKQNTMLINSTNVASVATSENALEQTVKNILSNPDYCQEYLRDRRIFVLDEDENDGNFKNEGSITIVGMEITNPPNPEDPENQPLSETKNLYLYYTKPALGSKQTRNGQECKSTDLSGCYYLKYNITPECTGACDDSYSNLINCRVSNAEDSDQTEPRDCTEDEIFNGIQSCIPVPANDFKSEIDNIQDNTFLMGIARIAGNNNENLQLRSVKLARQCPPGQYPIRVPNNGEIEVECQIMCTGGSTLNTDDPDNPLCECPENKPKYKQGACHVCRDIDPALTWNESRSDCVCRNSNQIAYTINGKTKCYNCPAGSVKTGASSIIWEMNPNIGQYYCLCRFETSFSQATWKPPPSNVCECRHGHKKFYQKNGVWDCYDCEPGQFIPYGYPELGCRTCPAGASIDPLNNRRCKCSNGRTWYPVENKCKCFIGNYYNNNKCIQCPYDGSWDNSKKKCKCYGGKNWRYSPDDGINKCVCPPNKYDYAGRCHRCPRGQHEYNNGCHRCPQDQHEYDNGCHRCPRGQHEYDNGCHRCPRGQHLYAGNCITCPAGSSWSNNRCNCGSGKVWKSATNTCSCPTNRPHDYAGRCNKCPQNQVESRGHCCPSGTPNWYYGICIRCPSGSQWSHNRCVCTGPKNRWSYVANQTNMCDCPSGQHWYANRECIRCPSGSSWSNNAGKCVCSGGGGRFWNTHTKLCDCPDGRQWLANLNRCGCPSGQHFHSDTNTCSECEEGYEKRMTMYASWNSAQQTWYNVKRMKCVKKCDSSQEVFTRFNGSTTCCPKGAVERGRCCPYGKDRYGGRCLGPCSVGCRQPDGSCCRCNQPGHWCYNEETGEYN